MMPTKYDSLIISAVEKWLPNYDWRLYKSQLYQESRFNPEAVSPMGAEGVAQFMPKTWAQWSVKAGFEGASPKDPKASIFTGACYMAYLLGEWSRPRPAMDRACLAMASYNAGLGTVLNAQKAVGDPPGYREIAAGLPLITGTLSQEPIYYVRRILSFYTSEITG